MHARSVVRLHGAAAPKHDCWLKRPDARGRMLSESLDEETPATQRAAIMERLPPNEQRGERPAPNLSKFLAVSSQTNHTLVHLTVDSFEAFGDNPLHPRRVCVLDHQFKSDSS